MKLLHTSDWHFGATANDRLLINDQRFFVDEICRIIEKENIDALLLAGDVYDRSLASADAIKLYDYAMTKICMEQKTEVICIAGNHDSAERLSSCSELLDKAGLHVAGRLKKEPAVVSCEDVDIYMLPWFTEERVKAEFPEHKEEIDSLEAAYKVVCDSLRADFKPGKKHIVVSHAFIVNAETSTSDRAAEIGFASAVSDSVFEGFDYVALGHIHKKQAMKEHIRYSGSPMPFSFGKEETQKKSVTIIDTDDMSIKECDLELLHIRKTLTGTLAELLEGECDDEVKNGYLRLQVTDSYVGAENIAALKAVYPNIIEVSGKEFENENSGVHMSMREFRELERDPKAVFERFCKDAAGMEEMDQHIFELFKKAVDEYEQGVDHETDKA